MVQQSMHLGIGAVSPQNGWEQLSPLGRTDLDSNCGHPHPSHHSLHSLHCFCPLHSHSPHHSHPHSHPPYPHSHLHPHPRSHSLPSHPPPPDTPPRAGSPTSDTPPQLHSTHLSNWPPPSAVSAQMAPLPTNTSPLPDSPPWP